MYTKPPSPDKSTCIILIDSFYQEPLKNITAEEWRHFNSFFLWVYKLETNPLPKLNKDCQFKTKNNSFEFQCFRQNNTHDCGLFTIIHMREFIVSVLSESMEYLLADCKNIQKLSCYYFHQNKDKYDPFQLLEMRQTSFYIICNIITKHQPNISVKNASPSMQL